LKFENRSGFTYLFSSSIGLLVTHVPWFKLLFKLESKTPMWIVMHFCTHVNEWWMVVKASHFSRISPTALSLS